MKIEIIGKGSKRELPSQFSEKVQPDLIKRAVLSLQSSRRQAYGSDPEAGMRYSAEVSRRRRAYRGSYGIGISRVPRKVMSRSGTRMNWTGAVAPGTVGGRRAHPPKSDKILSKKMNIKERRKALRSALSASIDKGYVAKKHRVPDNYPFIVQSSTEDLSRTKDAVKLFKDLGLDPEIERAAHRKVRAGKGKLRGRKYKNRKGPLMVVSGKCKLMEACANIPGVDVVDVHMLNTELLAPGAEPGRLAVFTEKALDTLEKEALFMNKKVE